MDTDNLLIKQELEKMTRRIEVLQTSVDHMLADRDMLETLNERVAELERATHTTRERLGEVQRSLENNSKATEYAIGEKVDEIKDSLNNSNVITVEKGVMRKLKKILKLEKGR